MLKIYFACSIRGGRENAAIYPAIVAEIKKHGEVLSEQFADKKLTASTVLDQSEILRQHCLSMINQADVIVAEVTTPSLGVGFEIATSEQLGKPVLALHRKDAGNLSAMIDGSDLTQVIHYTDNKEAIEAVQNFLLASINSYHN